MEISQRQADFQQFLKNKRHDPLEGLKEYTDITATIELGKTLPVLEKIAPEPYEGHLDGGHMNVIADYMLPILEKIMEEAGQPQYRNTGGLRRNEDKRNFIFQQMRQMGVVRQTGRIEDEATTQDTIYLTVKLSKKKLQDFLREKG